MKLRKPRRRKRATAMKPTGRSFRRRAGALRSSARPVAATV